MTTSTLQTEKSEGFGKKLLNKIKGFFVDFGKGCKDFFTNFGKSIKNFFKDPKTGLKNIWKWIKKQNGWLFLLPAIILMCIFTFYPIVNSLRLAFLEGYNPLDIYAEVKFGFGNFKDVVEGGLTAADFGICLKNTLILAFISVPLSTAIALLISVALNSIKALQKAYQTIFFLPYLTNALAMGAVFASLFQIIGTPSNIETYGLVNQVLSWFGVDPINWIDMAKGALVPDSTTAANYFVLIVYSTWSGLPFKILIIFGALQNVGKQYYDAAKIDGATKSTVLSKITVPLISPMISYLIITGLMGALKSYSSIVGVFGSYMGPNNDYEMGTMVGYIYSMIEENQTGYAAAGSIILFIIIMIFTAINLQVSKKKVHY